MKNKSLIAILVLSIFILGCQKDNPISSFTTDQDSYKVKESVQFTNTSEYGVSYYWDFGDGTFSSLKNPGHTYNEAGEYIVTLQVNGAKKTIASEFNKKILIMDSTNISTDVIFANSDWICDSITDVHHYCTGAPNIYSTNAINHSLSFNNDNTVLMLNNNIGNICEYEILNDSLIAFTENNYYRIWQYSIHGNRMTLMVNTLTPCTGSFPLGAQNGSYTVKHYYKL